VWRPADEPLPKDGEAQAAEHAARVARERQESAESGYPEYEVRIDLPSHKQALELVERLRGEGLPGSTVAVEGTWREAYADRPHSPFSFLGGLAE